jgi:methylmalonyl-CoA/ethylmalonyl-CoA epimerase
MPKNSSNQSPFAELHHIGFIVKDVQQTMKDLSALGLGPFEQAPMGNIAKRELRGKAVNADSDVWFTDLGRAKLELVQPLEGESLQKETLERRGEGVEHLGFFVDNLEEEVARLVHKGWKVVAGAKGPNGGGYTFLQSEKSHSLLVELVQPWE